LRRDVYFGFLKIFGEEHGTTLVIALNYTVSLVELKRSAEVKTLMRKLLPVARRLLGESNEVTLKMRHYYAMALFNADRTNVPTLDDRLEAVTIFEETERTARRVLGVSHPTTKGLGITLQNARAALRGRETSGTYTFPPPISGHQRQ
jgi:hypothetical protein